MLFIKKHSFMKKAIVILIALSFGSVGFAQRIKETDVPADVKTSFSTIFRNTPVEKWRREEGYYLAEFMKGGSEVVVTLDPSGTWMQTKTHIALKALPQQVADYVSKNYSDKKIADAYRIDHSSGEITFIADIKDNMLYFNSDGAFIKAEKEKRAGKFTTSTN
jgi:hypothetical protein